MYISDNIEENAREPPKCLCNVQKSLPTGVGKAEEMWGCAYRLRHRYGARIVIELELYYLTDLIQTLQMLRILETSRGDVA